MGFQIAIDGPSGSGKSTVARELAAQLRFVYIDTGAMYRAVGLYCEENGIDVYDENAVASALSGVEIDVRHGKEGQRLILNGKDVTVELRTPRAGMAAAAVAAFMSVRERLVSLQRQLAEAADVVMDGRDICAYVLPKADLKIYLDASVEARVSRRCGELEKNGVEFDSEEIRKQIIERDEKDKSREIAPLAVAEGAYVIDASELDINGVLNVILTLAKKCGIVV